MDIEEEIVTRLVLRGLRRGHSVSIYDGTGITLTRSGSVSDITQALKKTEEEAHEFGFNCLDGSECIPCGPVKYDLHI